ncbi:hypothetical protein B0T17DRAFT_31799 [Bombardia bombarda]|uniref:Uncharacterized protein n=1 Tax=Bombardia bombarda TaxID=252184 RepID=A0AA40CF60_9PEZI|nr:hypothetical protein B0T17DRAFT_31799 [Bombardia bombarda]
MPATATFDLGNIKAIRKQSNLSLTITTSFDIIMPHLCSEIPTAAGLYESSMAGDIWIAKAGSCQLEFLTLVDGKLPDSTTLEPAIIVELGNLAASCSVWEEIGLELRVKHSTPIATIVGRGSPQATYFLHHPDLSSDMIAPPNVPCAKFQGMKCEVNICFGTNKSKRKSEPHTTAPRPTDPTIPKSQPSESPPRHRYGLRSRPKPTKKAMAAQEDMEHMAPYSTSDTISPSSSRDSGELDQSAFKAPLISEKILTDISALLDGALHKLIGIKKAPPGTKIVESIPHPPLIDIAPAVWNLRYLQSMAAHAKVIPTIAHGIARLKSARSERLRQKVDKLTQSKEPNRQADEQLKEDGDTSEVRKKLWILCQTRIRVAPVARGGNRKDTNLDADLHTAEEAVPELAMVPFQPEPSQLEEAEGVNSYWEGSSSGFVLDVRYHQQAMEGNIFYDLPEGALGEFDNNTGDMEICQEEMEDPFYDLVEEAPGDNYHHITDLDDLGHVTDGDAYYQLPEGDAGELVIQHATDELSQHHMHYHNADSGSSSEADYFYADGYGNIYPVERPRRSETLELEWVSEDDMTPDSIEHG